MKNLLKFVKDWIVKIIVYIAGAVTSFVGRIKKFFGKKEKEEKSVKSEEKEKTEESGTDEKRNKFLFWMIAGIIYFIFVMFDLFYLSRFHYENVIWGMDWNWGFAAFLLQVFYLLISFQTVGPTELGAILLFGKPLFNVGSGLIFAPFIMCQLVKETRNVIEDELPAKPELIFRSKKEEPDVVPENLLKLGFKPPIRTQFGSPDIVIDIDPEENQIRKELYEELNKFIERKAFKEDDPLNVRMTAETPLVVRWKIKNLVDFLQTFGTIENARDQMQDIAVAMLNRDFSKITPAVTQSHFGIFSKLILNEISERIGSGGIEILTVLLRPFVYSHELNDKILEKAKALVGKSATITNAEAQKEKDKLEGEGRGLAEKAILDNRTAGLKNMAKELGVSPEIVIGAETSRKITENPGQKTIIVGPDGLTKLITAASAIGEAIRKEER